MWSLSADAGCLCTLFTYLQAILGPSPQVLLELLNSIWAGWESQPAGTSKEATAACFQDLLCVGLDQGEAALATSHATC